MVIQIRFCTEGHIMIYLLITLRVHVRAGVMCSGLVSIYIYTRNVLLSAQMGERASVVLICIITSRYNEVK